MSTPRTLAFEFATGAGEPAGVWVRVSSGGQDEANQVPDIRRHVESETYNVVRQYVLHDKSASKGEQDAKLQQVIADMAAGIIRVLVCWHSDRLDRRGPKAGYAFLYSAELVGGRIESVLDPEFGKDDVGSEVLTTIRMASARDESKLKSERIRIANDTIDANGSVRGRAIFGFRNVGDKKYHKTLEIYEPEAEIIRDAVRWYLAGQSLAHICSVLNKSGRLTSTGKKWTSKILSQVLNSTTIMGRHKQGETEVRVPEIITVREWNDVQARLAQRAYRAGVRQRKDTALLTGILRCGYCQRGLYRIRTRDGEFYYERAVKGVESCKMLFPLEQIDSKALQILLLAPTAPITREEFIPGQNYQNEIDQLALDIKALNPLEPGWLDRVTAMQAEIARLSALPAVPDRIETVEVDLSEYVAKWPTMTTDERRSVLMEHGIKIYVTKDDDGSPVLSATLPKR